MNLLELCKWLEQTSWGLAVRDSLWLFPTIETVHLLGIILLVGSISMLDLRLLGFTMIDQPVSRMARQFLPWAWVGFSVQVVTGVLLTASEATKMYANISFRLKMLLILGAGINALIFHFTLYRKVTSWDDSIHSPVGAKVAGCLSIVLWCGVVAAGRWIGFT